MPADLWIGRVIDTRYVVEGTIGQGGMGVVLRARHRFTGAHVALKMMRPDLAANADIQDRFLAEARASSAIGHPSIVQVLDAGRTPEGELYLAMELLAGRTLRRAMYPAPPPQVTRRIILELLDALAAAHARGIVHRDLKPDNVFLAGPAQTVKLLDFGIAKMVQAATHAGGFTAAGAVLGTLAYMAPEQLLDASTVDHRADLWAVGVMLYELTSGQLPYRGASLTELMESLAQREPTPIAAYVRVPAAVEAFFGRALARDRARRFASAQEMAAAIATLHAEPGSVAPPPSSVPGATVASASGAPARAVPLPTTARAPTAPTPRMPTAVASSRAWLWGIGFVVALVVVVAIAASLARDGSEAGARDAGSPAAASSDRDAACVDVCRRVEGCDFGIADCMHACRTNDVAFGCMQRDTCEARAVCLLAFQCPTIRIAGELGCRVTIDRIVGCGGDQSCTCTMLEGLDPAHAIPLLRVSTCAFQSCPAGSPEDCIVTRCQARLDRCVD